MSVKKFKFVSPGIFLSEVDNSQLPAIRQAVGPIIIGRTRMGPSMRPYTVESPSEFVQVFGNPVPGQGSGADIWRAGNSTGPTYAAYAAMAYLKANVGPITMVRLLGEDNPSATGAGIALSGWTTDQELSPTTGGGAYGIFVFASGSTSEATGTLGAIVYINSGSVALEGTALSTSAGGATGFVGYGAVMESEGQNSQFKLNIFDTSDQASSVTLLPATVTSTIAGTHALVVTDTLTLTIDAEVSVAPAIAATTAFSEAGGTFVDGDVNCEFTYQINTGGSAFPAETVDCTGASPGNTITEWIAFLNTNMNGVSVDENVGNIRFTTDVEGSEAQIVLSGFGGNFAAATGFAPATSISLGPNNVGNINAVTDTELAALIQAAITAGPGVGTAVAAAGGGVTITGVTPGPTGQIIIAAGAPDLAAKIGFTAATVTGTSVAAAAPTYSTAFNFDRNSDLFIRNVLNTNPQLTNAAFVNPLDLKGAESLYWLGESFETDVIEALNGSEVRSRAVLLPLATGSLGATKAKEDYKGVDFQYANTGYFFAQDLTSNSASYTPESQIKLFRVTALDGGRWIQDNLKISIQAIKASTNTTNKYGSFNLLVRVASDRDNVVQVVEQFTNVNLNPSSENFIGRVIGDSYYKFDYPQRVMRQYGKYANKSKYIRVDINPILENGSLPAELLPFGVTGPLRFKSVAVTSGSGLPANAFMQGSGSSPGDTAPTGEASPTNGIWMGDTTVALADLKLNFPEQLLRLSASDGGLADPTDAYFGPMSTISRDSSRVDPGWGDYMWRRPDGVTATDNVSGLVDDLVEYSWAVSLDDVVLAGSATAYWKAGSRADGNSATAISSSWKEILAQGYDRITAPMYGGFDGLDITEAEPFRNGVLSDGAPANLDTSNYAFNSIKRAIDTVKDPEFVECNIMTIPGVTNSSLIQHLIDTCEDRADALAIIDLPNVYTPFTDSDDTFEQRNDFSINDAVNGLRSRGINSSYACTYYPWVQVLDTISNQLLWAPPSVVALGTLASSEAKSEVWFAPAGFNRGGLTEGAAGWPVINVTKRLTSKDRDNLYEANINPIATFPSEGIVVFGQKTLQVTQSALDRINVRRLLIYIKKQVSRISSGILFDQNVQVTWNRFLGQVRPFLASVQSRLGLSEWKVILDDTTTTPDLVDQNIMYAKIFLKPSRSIEFIAVDFVITRTGASFDD